MAHPFEKEFPPDQPWFTPRAEQVLALAHKQATRLGHASITVEHLILGMIELNQGMAVDVLKRMQVDLGALRAESLGRLEAMPKEASGSSPVNSPRVTKVLELAPKEAQRLHHTYTGTEHILLALLREARWRPRSLPAKLNLKIHRVASEIQKTIWNLAALP